MTLRTAVLLAVLAASPAARAGSLWPLGGADARLIEAGWRRDAKTGAWSAEVELRLVNRDLTRSFHRPVLVEFVDAAGRGMVWKTFVSLAPGTAQHRRINAPGRLDCPGPPALCPALSVRVELKRGDSRAALQPIGPQELADPDAPPVGRPLYVAAVEDGAVLRLLDGRRVRPLGVHSAPGAPSAAAAAWARGLVMDGPVTLAYDGLPRDKSGRWQAYVALDDGRDLGAELMRRSLAVLDAQSVFARKGSYQSITPEARRQPEP